MLESFFNLHRFPVGPLLFLRYWGLTFDHPLSRRSQDHKIDLIRHIMSLYDDLPFILIGDSGQKDPEIYARIVHEIRTASWPSTSATSAQNLSGCRR